MDNALKAILDFTKYEQFMRLQSLVLGETTSKLSVIRNRHKMSLDMKPEFVSQEFPDYTEYVFQKENPSPGVVDINVVKLFKKSCMCRLKCQECDICMHTVSCECQDFLVQYNLCSHVHYIKRNIEPVKATFELQEGSQLVIDDCEEATSFLENPLSHVNSLTSSQENTIESSVKSLVSEAAIILQSCQNSNQIKALV